MKVILGCLAILLAGVGKLTNDARINSAPPEVKKLLAYDPGSFGRKAESSMLNGIANTIGLGAYDRGFEAVGIDSKEEAPEGYEVVEDREYELSFSFAPVDNTVQEIPWGVEKVRGVEAQEFSDGSDVTVCVVDTGADSSHPDLKNMIVGGSGHAGDKDWEDDQGHGTHVAGTIAAEANKIGVIGVSQAKLFIVKVLGASGSGYGSWIAAGVVSCVQNGAKIISMSLGSPASRGPDKLIADAIKYAQKKGAIVVAANGNDSKAVGYPAALEGVIGVAASDSNNRLARFSSRGEGTDVIAPGVDVLSTKMGGGYHRLNGTSMATPHVSGVLAMALMAGKGIIANDIGLPKNHQGIGLIDALKSVGQ